MAAADAIITEKVSARKLGTLIKKYKMGSVPGEWPNGYKEMDLNPPLRLGRWVRIPSWPSSAHGKICLLPTVDPGHRNKWFEHVLNYAWVVKLSDFCLNRLGAIKTFF